MRNRMGCISAFLALALLTFGGILILIQQHQEMQELSVYHAAILAQAPCIEKICPGFAEGRANAIELLARSEFVQGIEQGTYNMGLLFIDNEANIVGSGGAVFAADTQGALTTVHDISFHLHSLRLESVINAIGEPDQFLFLSGCGKGLRVRARLFYFSQGIEVSIDYATRRPQSQLLTGNTPVDYIVYLPPTNFQNYIEESTEDFVGPFNIAYDFHPSVTVDDILAQIRPWPGIAAVPTPTADFCPR